MDYGVNPCNTSAINLNQNPIQHSKTEHIEIRHHFIRNHIKKGEIEIKFGKLKTNWLTYSLNHLHVIDSTSLELN